MDLAHTKTVDEVLQEFKVTEEEGLDTACVEEQRRKHGLNGEAVEGDNSMSTFVVSLFMLVVKLGLMQYLNVGASPVDYFPYILHVFSIIIQFGSYCGVAVFVIATSSTKL